jgi:molybdenum cofactor guanylyltransferase
LDVSCIILAGGKSKRLGRNKVTEKIGNASLLERVISAVAPLNNEIIIVAAKESSLPQLTNYPKLKLVTDIYPGKGSLGGVFTGLTVSETLYNLVVACDMPFLNLDLLRYMVELAGGFDAVVPKLRDNILEPLHAVYSRNCISAMESLVKQNRLSILELFPLIKVRFIGEAEIESFDPKHLTFFNINTETDLEAGRSLLKRESKID